MSKLEHYLLEIDKQDLLMLLYDEIDSNFGALIFNGVFLTLILPYEILCFFYCNILSPYFLAIVTYPE
jgi:hypothetical protein